MSVTSKLGISCGLLVLTACAPLHITAPDESRQTQAIPQIAVEFHNDYRQGSFGATLNGVDVTSSVFASCVGAAAGTTCAVSAPPFGQSENALRVSGRFAGSQAFATCCDSSTIRPAEILFSLDAQGNCYNPPALVGGSSSSGSGSSGASTGVVPGPRDSCVPEFRLIVNETQTKTIFVLLPAAPAAPAGQTVTVTPASNAVSLNNAPAGAAVTVTVPANDRRAPLNVRAISGSGGNFDMRAEAAGYATAHGHVCTRSAGSLTGC